MMKWLLKILGDPNEKKIKAMMGIVDHINALEPEFAAMTDEQLKAKTAEFKEILPILEAHDDYSIDSLHDLVMDFIAKKEVKNGLVLWPLRTAVSGKQSTPGGAFEIMEIIGKEESLRRIKVGIEKLS